MMTLAEIKTALRQGEHAWPGGYPRFFASLDGEAAVPNINPEWDT
jgi:hypothetical protein